MLLPFLTCWLMSVLLPEEGTPEEMMAARVTLSVTSTHADARRCVSGGRQQSDDTRW